MRKGRLQLLLWAVLLLTRPDGGRIWIVDSQVIAVFEAKGVGAAPTAIATQTVTFYVRESVDAVVQMLGWKQAEQ